MGSKSMILALVFFAMIFMASAIDDPSAALKDASDAPIAVEDNNIIGTIDGTYENGAVAAAPVGGPISRQTFPNINLPPSPPNGATTSTPDIITIATTIVSTAVAASVFF